ncbi:MAG: glycosyltransferase, partial [Clostridia bacterium]|nr:glycosyltransferase [Clostridia bacterium]
MNVVKAINIVISVLFTVCYAYQFFYIAVPFYKKGKPHKRTYVNRFAVLIAARNEQGVIEHLIRSIQDQTYPSEYVDIYVVADNCTDGTAAVSRELGAIVYERFNKTEIGKGYALEALLENIARDYPRGFDGYFVFDADNLLAPDYIERMHETFCSGYEVVTSYR